MKLSIKDFADSFRSIIRPEDDVVLVYSGIWKFGSLLAVPVRELPQRLLEAIIEVVGPDRTLMLPTYTNYFARIRRFDLVQSEPETGVLPRVFLEMPGTMRTPSSMNSYGVRGPLAKLISQIDGRTLWGEGSVMAWIHEQNVRICVIGLPWHECCGFFHYSEELVRVPYRYYKAFRGEWSNGGRGTRPCTEVMYVRPQDVMLDFRWERVAEAMERNRGILSCPSKEILMESAKAQEIVRASLDLLRRDPYALLGNRDEVREWVRAGKAIEMGRLKDDEIPPGNLPGACGSGLVGS